MYTYLVASEFEISLRLLVMKFLSPKPILLHSGDPYYWEYN